MMISILLLLLVSVIFYSDDFSQVREQMVSRTIAARGINDKPSLYVMRKVPRHLFVPSNQSANAYQDRPLPIGYGQTISQPYIMAYMTEIIDPKQHHKVLEIGTGFGYQAAVLAEIVKEVYTIEIVSQLGEPSKELLKSLNYNKVKVKIGDGYFGWADASPFDAIIVTAAAEYIPPKLIEQLKDDGKMIIPIGSPFLKQQLMLVEKKDGRITTKNMMPVRFVPFTRIQ